MLAVLRNRLFKLTDARATCESALLRGLRCLLVPILRSSRCLHARDMQHDRVHSQCG